MRRQQGSRGGSRRWLVNLTLLLATLLVCVLGLELVCRLLPTGPDKTHIGARRNVVNFLCPLNVDRKDC